MLKTHEGRSFFYIIFVFHTISSFKIYWFFLNLEKQRKIHSIAHNESSLILNFCSILEKTSSPLILPCAFNRIWWKFNKHFSYLLSVKRKFLFFFILTQSWLTRFTESQFFMVHEFSYLSIKTFHTVNKLLPFCQALCGRLNFQLSETCVSFWHFHEFKSTKKAHTYATQASRYNKDLNGTS